MAKKLLNAVFRSINGEYNYSLGSDSSDNIPITQPIAYKNSKNEILGQVGCGFQLGDNNSPHAVSLNQYALYKALDKSGYDARIACMKNTSQLGVKMYLNGVATDEDNNPMPYIKYILNASGNPVVHYFQADDTDLGVLFRSVVATGDSTAGWFAGQLYDDGTFIGSAGPIRDYNLSTNRYEWYCTNNFTPPTYPNGVQLIYETVINDLQNYLPIEPEGEFSEVGIGDFDATSDEVDFPSLPSLDVISTGLCSIYKMSSAYLVDLADFLWSNLFDPDTFKKLFSNPMEAILNLSIMPIDATAENTPSAVKIGNITTDAYGFKLTSQYKEIDFGKINLNEYWGSFADYSPYTKLSIFLPYVGVQQLSIDDVMNGSINLKAYIDVLTGSIQYVLKSKQGNHRQHGHNSVLYTWGGNCQYQIPLSASNMTQVINSIVSTAGTVVSGIGVAAATGGMTAPIAAGMAASTISNVMNAKTHIQRGGGIGGSIGIFGVQKPYLILERPEEVYPENYNHTVGEPSSKTGYLSQYSGFVKVEACNLTISGASEDDLNEIESLLKGGVLV